VQAGLRAPDNPTQGLSTTQKQVDKTEALLEKDARRENGLRGKTSERGELTSQCARETGKTCLDWGTEIQRDG
jgi:hypothetical protein